MESIARAQRSQPNSHWSLPTESSDYAIRFSPHSNLFFFFVSAWDSHSSLGRSWDGVGALRLTFSSTDTQFHSSALLIRLEFHILPMWAVSVCRISSVEEISFIFLFTNQMSRCSRASFWPTTQHPSDVMSFEFPLTKKKKIQTKCITLGRRQMSLKPQRGTQSLSYGIQIGLVVVVNVSFELFCRRSRTSKRERERLNWIVMLLVSSTKAWEIIALRLHKIIFLENWKWNSLIQVDRVGRIETIQENYASKVSEILYIWLECAARVEENTELERGEEKERSQTTNPKATRAIVFIVFQTVNATWKKTRT